MIGRTRRTPHPDVTMSTTRTEAYTDAVFAIAATLLVLELTTNSIGEVSSDAQLWQKLGDMWPSFMSFGVSFALLSLLWMIHVEQFRDIVRVDTGLLWLNNARLLFIVLIPFTTSLTSDYSEYFAGRMLFPINFFFAALLGYLSWQWAAARGGHLLRDGIDDRRAQGLGGLSATIIGAVVVMLSPWFGSWAFLAYFLNSPLTTLLTRHAERRDHAESSGNAG